MPQQAGYQIAALAVALGIAIVSGALTGLLLKAPIWDNLTTEELYEDEVFWDVSYSVFEQNLPSLNLLPLNCSVCLVEVLQ